MSGNDAKSLHYYERLDSILGTWAASSPPFLLDSAGPSTTLAMDSQEQENGAFSVSVKLKGLYGRSVLKLHVHVYR